MTNLIAQIAKDLKNIVEVTEDNTTITKDFGDLVFFKVNGEAYSAELTKTGKVKKNSAKPYDSYS